MGSFPEDGAERSHSHPDHGGRGKSQPFGVNVSAAAAHSTLIFQPFCLDQNSYAILVCLLIIVISCYYLLLFPSLPPE